MKILYHHRTQGQGAEGVHIRGICEAFRSLGHEVTIVSPQGVDEVHSNRNSPIEPQSRLPDVLRWFSKNLPQFIFECFEITYNFYAYFRLKTLLKRGNFDLYYERYAFFNNISTALAKRYNIPIILEVNEISGIPRFRGQTMTRLASYLEKRTFLRADALLVVSSFLQSRLIERGVAPEKVHVFPNAIRLDDFNLYIDGSVIREKYGIADKIVLGFVGLFAPWDRLDALIELFGQLCRRYNNLHLLLIGYGKNSKELEYKAKSFGLENKVTFSGKVERNEIPLFLQALDIALLPHSNPFGSPLVLFEYMAMAKPIIAPKLPPIDDVIQDGVNGLTFSPGDMNAFEKKMAKLIENPLLRRKLGEAAHKQVEEKHTWEANASRAISLVADIISTRKKST